jgi:NADH-quinone oxidoreductase subunit M
MGLPGLAGFVGEILCFAGAFQGGNADYHFQLWSLSVSSSVYFKVLTSFSVIGVVLGAGYFLWSYQKVFQGPLNPKYANLEDMTVREMVTVWPLAIMSITAGRYTPVGSRCSMGCAR